jgi:serine/threonine protein phosphatase PrpC
VASGTSLEFGEQSDVGLRRAANQDAKAVLAPWSAEQYRRRGWLFVVADGMGAHAAGETASALAAEHVPLVYEKHAAHSPPLALRLGIEQANAEIHARGETSLDLKGMGTTCTTLAIVPRGAIVGHVGDSRAYRIRGGTIEQLSRDHSLVWEIEARRAAGEQGLPDVPRNVITRSLGPHPRVEVDLEGPFGVEDGDVFVLCSDGLSGQVADEEIGALAANLAPARAAEALVGLTLARGAPDNVTVIVARAGPAEASRASAGDEPWPMGVDEAVAAPPAAFPVKTLAAAAATLLAALVLSPASDLMRDGGLLGGLLGGMRETVAWVTCAVLGLTSLALVLTALVGFFVPAGGQPLFLPVGRRAGGGPYRRHDCRLTPALVEGIADTIATAADGLDAARAARTAAAVERVRHCLAGGDLAGGLDAAAAAIGGYTASVGESRR